MRSIEFFKGHGTGNDFVLVLDPDGLLDLSADDVRFLCDRHFGIGADGLIRATPGRFVPGAEPDLWFMDYRNADGSIAEMCGNGARVFLRLLADHTLMSDQVSFGTRAGVLAGRFVGDQISIDMGPAVDAQTRATIRIDESEWPSTGVLMPNPHAVVFTDSLDDCGSLLQAPSVDPASEFPEGVNVEFVVEKSPEHVAMRVHERGVGETLSCGTGACAVAWAYVRNTDRTGPAVTRVDVPGGTVTVTEDERGHMHLQGPAVIVARGTVTLP